jgi:hypothetical protein
MTSWELHNLLKEKSLQAAVAAHFLTRLAVKTVKQIRDSTSLSDKEVKPSFRLTSLTSEGV